MFRIIFKVGDIVDENTEGLVCTGNVQLNMSGGVNGELLSRGGVNMQRQLHDRLRELGRRYVNPGFVMRIGPAPFQFKSIIYTVAVDAWYESSVDLVKESLDKALELIEEDNCTSVSIPALATGYGRLSKSDFGIALKRCLTERDWSFRDVRIVLSDELDLKAVKKGYDNSGDTKDEMSWGVGLDPS